MNSKINRFLLWANIAFAPIYFFFIRKTKISLKQAAILMYAKTRIADIFYKNIKNKIEYHADQLCMLAPLFGRESKKWYQQTENQQSPLTQIVAPDRGSIPYLFNSQIYYSSNLLEAGYVLSDCLSKFYSLVSNYKGYIWEDLQVERKAFKKVLSLLLKDDKKPRKIYYLKKDRVDNDL